MEITDQPWFLNCAVELETELMPKQFIGAVLDIEREMGRKRTKKKGPRTIDIDVLLFGKSIIEMKGLTVPHPAMHLRRFVLEPMVEIAPELRHPVFKRSMREMRRVAGRIRSGEKARYHSRLASRLRLRLRRAR